MQGELYVARRRYPVTTPAPLPPELEEVIGHPLANVRAGAVEELARLGRGKHAGLAIAAKLALERLADDDSRTVSTAAAAALGVVDVPSSVQPADGLRPTPESQQTPDVGEERRSIDTTAVQHRHHRKRFPRRLHPAGRSTAPLASSRHHWPKPAEAVTAI